MHRLQREITNIHGLTEHVAEHHNLGSVNVNKIKDQGSNNIQYEQIYEKRTYHKGQTV